MFLYGRKLRKEICVRTTPKYWMKSSMLKGHIMKGLEWDTLKHIHGRV
jgi:hypothetical protein